MGKTRGRSTVAKSSRSARFPKWAEELWQEHMATQNNVDELKTCRSALSCLLVWITGELEEPHLCRPKLQVEPMPQWARDISKDHLRQGQRPDSLRFYQRTFSIMKDRLQERLENLGEPAPRVKAERTPSPTLSDYERIHSSVRSRSRTRSDSPRWNDPI